MIALDLQWLRNGLVGECQQGMHSWHRPRNLRSKQIAAGFGSKPGFKLQGLRRICDVDQARGWLSEAVNDNLVPGLGSEFQ